MWSAGRVRPLGRLGGVRLSGGRRLGLAGHSVGLLRRRELTGGCLGRLREPDPGALRRLDPRRGRRVLARLTAGLSGLTPSVRQGLAGVLERGLVEDVGVLRARVDPLLGVEAPLRPVTVVAACLLYTSDAADE